jgi:transcriptional regulator with XRE-family HTH domain
MEIGEVIKQLRMKQGLTQAQLGERCGISDQAVSNIETGKTYPPKGTIGKICRALGENVSYLLAKVGEDDVPDEQRAVYRALLEMLKKEMTDEPETDKQS